MVDNMLKIAITPHNIIPNEAQYIICILEHNWDYIHLRHPNASLTEIKQIIEQIPQRYHCRIKLHGHFELTNEFNLGGIHLNNRCHIIPSSYNGKLTKSCHTIQEVNNIFSDFEYVTLSPIFDSISKNGYNSTFDEKQLASITAPNVIALGGITPIEITKIQKLNFAGFATLGYLFDNLHDIQSLENRLNKFYNQLCCNS